MKEIGEEITTDPIILRLKRHDNKILISCLFIIN